MWYIRLTIYIYWIKIRKNQALIWLIIGDGLKLWHGEPDLKIPASRNEEGDDSSTTVFLCDNVLWSLSQIAGGDVSFSGQLKKLLLNIYWTDSVPWNYVTMFALSSSAVYQHCTGSPLSWCAGCQTDQYIVETGKQHRQSYVISRGEKSITRGETRNPQEEE